MTDFEKQDLNGQPAENVNPQPTETQPVEAQPAETQNAAPAVPQLTLEPDPVPPVIPTAQADPAASSAQAFQMPEPPRAPEPPTAVPQQPQPGYYSNQTQYTPPQYTPGYNQAPQQPYYSASKPLYNTPPAGYVQKSRLAAGLLAIMLGVFGVHNFYLGFNSRGTIQLVVSLVGILLSIVVIGMFAVIAMGIWGFIEGVMILSATNTARLYDGNGVILKD